MKPLISVIVPVYNAGLSIEKCAKSILTQTFSNLELIFIDDGSTDNSLFICRSLASQDARITVRHQSNQGVSKARNLGISISKGEWIAFVDADDGAAVEVHQVDDAIVIDAQDGEGGISQPPHGTGGQGLYQRLHHIFDGNIAADHLGGDLGGQMGQNVGLDAAA